MSGGLAKAGNASRKTATAKLGISMRRHFMVASSQDFNKGNESTGLLQLRSVCARDVRGVQLEILG